MIQVVVDLINRAPQSPGVYLMKGGQGKILYVGKAKCLRDRLRSYVNPAKDERPSIFLMVPQVEWVEWVITENEKEALLLENSFIKTHRPRYNILLRDDKSYVSLHLSAHAFPRLHITRKIVKDGGEYFGPYSSALELRKTLNILQRTFQIRDCKDSFFAHRTRPCLQHQIKRCTAPCVNLVSLANYEHQVREVRMFLRGETQALVSQLHEEMSRASQFQRFEEAAKIRDRWMALQGTLEKQKVESRQDERDADVVGIAGDSDATLLKVLKVRRGRIVAADEFFVPEPISASREIHRAFLQQNYLDHFPSHGFPKEFLLSENINDSKEFEDLLADQACRKIRILRPQRGKAHRLLRLAHTNAMASLAERKRRSEKNFKILEELQRKLHLKNLPTHIEGYDISTFHGAEPVGSKVVFIEGEPDKTKYRHFNIRGIKGSNDFAMLKEMFDRRFKNAEQEELPDLIVVDGGKGQLRQIVDVVGSLGLTQIDLASIAKEKEFTSRSGKKYAPERIFLPGQKNAIVFPPASPVLHLLMRIRDEAHRFGITRHRRARGRSALTSLLARIPGIGKVRQQSMLRSMGSLESVTRATIEELAAVKGMGPKPAKAVYDFLHTVKRDPTEE